MSRITPLMADNTYTSELEQHFPRITEEFLKRWHAVLDVDSDRLNDFSDTDATGLKAITQIIERTL